MRADLTADQELFRETTQRFIEQATPLTRVRELYDHADGFDHDWWRKASEIGWTSMYVPESLGGGSLSGLPTVDAVIVAEEMGRQLTPGPFLPVNVVADAVSRSGSDLQRRDLLPRLLSGETIATWACAEAPGRWDADAVHATAEIHSDGIVLSGTKAFVEAAATADVLLVTARTGAGLTQVLVPTDAPGVSVTKGRSVDMTRRFGTVHLDEVGLPGSALLGAPGEAAADVARALHVAVALQCAELVGIADRTLEFTLEYGRDRFAFGRPIVSFQALKHRIADMVQWLEAAKAVSDALAQAVDTDAADTETLMSVAKAYVGERTTWIVDDCVQITGGIGVTWEHDIHLYNRRVIVDRAVFGSPEEHKERLFALLDNAQGGTAA